MDRRDAAPFRCILFPSLIRQRLGKVMPMNHFFWKGKGGRSSSKYRSSDSFHIFCYYGQFGGHGSRIQSCFLHISW